MKRFFNRKIPTIEPISLLETNSSSSAVADRSDALDVSKLQQQELVQHKKGKQEKISEEFIVEHLPIVESVASGISGGTKIPTGVTYQDLVSWGVEGLIKAKNNYKDDRGTKFKTYAYYRIRGEILDKLRREWSYRNPSDYKLQQERIQLRIAEVAQDALEVQEDAFVQTDEREEKINDVITSSAVVYLLSLEDLDPVSESQGTGDPSIEIIDDIDRSMQHSILWEEINALSPEEKQIIELFYVKDLKQKEIADELHLSRSKVCRIHMKILDKLKRRLSRRFEV